MLLLVFYYFLKLSFEVLKIGVGEGMKIMYSLIHPMFYLLNFPLVWKGKKSNYFGYNWWLDVTFSIKLYQVLFCWLFGKFIKA